MQEIITTGYEVADQQMISYNMLQDFANFIDASPCTVKAYCQGVKQLFGYLLEKGIRQPTRQDIVEYREELKISHKATTVQNYMVAIKIFFKWTASRGLYPNIAENLKGAKISREHKKDYLNSRQIRKLLSSIDTETISGKRDYAITSLMVTGGLRDTEVVNANIEDMRTLGDYTVLYLLGKGREEKAEYIKIVEPVEEAIRDYLKARGKVLPEDPLFVSHSNKNINGRLTTRSVSRICKNALVDAGYNTDRLTAHSLRHTAVTLALLGGKSLQEAQQFARHSNIATTQIYAHNLDRMKNDCEEVVAKAIFQ